MAKVLSIVVPVGFQPVEYLESRRALENAGHEVRVASIGPTAIDKAGATYEMDLLINEVREADHDAVLFVGGPGTVDYFDNQEFHQLARAFYESGKWTTAICAAPVILGRAGLLKGKKVTSFPSQADNVKKTGAIHTAAAVEQDGKIITADGPESAFQFGQKIAENLSA